MWAAAQANGVHVFIHTQTGGVKVNDPTATTLKVVMEQAAQVNQPMTEKSASKRMITQCVYGPIVPQQVICELIGGGVPERYPDLHFALIEFNAHWLASLVGSMDKCWVTGIGQDADWWLGNWDDTRPDNDQPSMAQLFRLNEKWPYPLEPSEYVQRQFHVSFQDDPVAVACRHVTGLSTIVWGNDYPHAEGTFRGSRELIAKQFGDLPADERAALVGGTLAGLLGFDASMAGASSAADPADEDVGERLRDVARRHATARLEPQVRVVVHAEPREGGEPRVDVAELSRVDAGLQDRLDPPLVLAPPHAELLGAFARERGELVEEDPDVIGIAVDDVEQLVAEHRQLLRRRPARLRDAIGAEHHLVHHPIVDRGEELFLRLDVVVEGALAETVDRAQLRDAGGVVALAREDLRRGVDDDVATRLPLLAAPGLVARCGSRQARKYSGPVGTTKECRG